MKKILFLDVDGVLNHVDTFKKRNKNFLDSDLDEDCLICLHDLMAQMNDLIIVLTSSWRMIPQDLDRLESAFKAHDIPKWIDVTPYLEYERNKTRGNEINLWLKRHALSKERIVILDDNNDMADLMDRLVQTSFTQGGLTKKHIDKIKKLLEGN